MRILTLSAADVGRAVSMAEAINIVEKGFIEHSSGRSIMPLRQAMLLGDTGDYLKDGLVSLMPSLLQSTGLVGIKSTSIVPRNRPRGLPLIHSLMLVFETHSGTPIALFDGAELTNIRTGAVAGAATRCLASPHAQTLAMIGAGALALRQIEAILCTRDVTHIKLSSASAASARALKGKLLDLCPKIEVTVHATVSDATRDADIISLATTAGKPILFLADVKQGAHINAMGWHTTSEREVSSEILAQSRVVVEDREAALSESCETYFETLGDVLRGNAQGRGNDNKITCFSSVGVAISDLAVSFSIYNNAISEKLGSFIDL